MRMDSRRPASPTRLITSPTETTVLGAGVDVNLHPVIGLGGRLDWGVKAYDPGTNGGIVGTVSYDTTRNELDPSVRGDRKLAAQHRRA